MGKDKFCFMFDEEDLRKMRAVVVADLKHHTDPSRRIANNDNIRRDMYAGVIREMLPLFKHTEKLDDGTVREGIFIKGYVRDVWDYLGGAYDLIHSRNFEVKCRDSQVDKNRGQDQHDSPQGDLNAEEVQRLQQLCEVQSRQISELKKYFTSGNSVPVERANILAKDFWRIIGEEPDGHRQG